MSKPLFYLEDCTVGMQLRSPEITVTEDDIIAYARQFDPQPFHLSHEEARDTFFGELVASGWHTASLTMRLTTEVDRHPAWGFVGKGVDGIAWHKPVRPGDRLHVIVEMVDIRQSQSRPGLGTVKMRITAYDHTGEEVLTMTPNVVVPSRQLAEAKAAERAATEAT